MKKREPKKSKTTRRKYFAWQYRDGHLLINPNTGGPCLYQNINYARRHAAEVPGRPVQAVLKWEVNP